MSTAIIPAKMLPPLLFCGIDTLWFRLMVRVLQMALGENNQIIDPFLAPFGYQSRGKSWASPIAADDESMNKLVDFVERAIDTVSGKPIC